MVSLTGVVHRIPGARRLVAAGRAFRRPDEPAAARGRIKELGRRARELDSRVEETGERVQRLERNVKEHKLRVKELEKQLSGPSFRRYLEAERRTSEQWREVFRERRGWKPDLSPDPRYALIQKLRGKAVVRSAGLAMPEVYRTWATIDEIDLDGLPEHFVLKSAGGATSHGVLPVRREGDGFRVISTDKVLSAPEITAYLTAKRAAGKVRAPFFAEEFLTGVTGSEILEDVKIYAFYGEIGHVLLRAVGTHGDSSSVRYRYLDEKGIDLGPVSRSNPVDPTIPVPGQLPEMIRVARELSQAARIPFLRVDLYETDRGVMFGEFTPRPGGEQEYVPEHDRALGVLWEQARLRLDAYIAEQVRPVPDWA